MKKWAIGCGVAVLLMAVAGGIGLYWVYSKARSYVGAFEQMGQVADLDKQVTNQAAFTPPTGGEVTQAQVDSFVTVNELVQGTLGPRFAGLKAKYDSMESRMKAEGRQVNPGEALAAVRDLATVFKDVRTAQVAALNAQKLSVAEYRWIRDQVYGAAGIPIAAFNMGAFVEAAKSGNAEGIEESMKGAVEDAAAVTDATRQLIKPHVKKLEEWASIAWLGF